MAADHLRALIARRAPGRSVRELERAAGVPQGRLSYWLPSDTSTRRITRLPTLSQLGELARVIGCTAAEVRLAVQRDVDPSATLTDDLGDDERSLLAAYRRLAEGDRRRLIAIADVLGNH